MPITPWCQPGSNTAMVALSSGSGHVTAASYSQTISTDDLITSQIGQPIGANGIPSSGAIGGSQDTPLIYPFKNEISLIGLSGESFRFEWITSKEGVYLLVSDWEINAFEMAHNLRTAQ